ncbi:MAG: zinc ribbon domain-containing protein, partial [Promethearchaeota archaeon]
MSRDTIPCPRCGQPIYSDEVACTRCRLIIRYFCDRCNNPVLIYNKFCTKCGAPNPKYDPSLAPPSVENKQESLDQEPHPITKPRLQDEDEKFPIEKEFDEECSKIEKEIENLKKVLDTRMETHAAKTDKLNSQKTPDMDKSIENTRSSNNAPSPFLLDFDHKVTLLERPVVDEAHLIIQSIPITSADESKEREIIKLLDYWDAEVYVHSKSRREPIHI